MDERSLRLQERFGNIRQAIAETSNRDIAYATAAVGWLEAIEYYCLQALRKVEQHVADEAGAERVEQLVAEQHQEIRNILKQFHADLCDHLGLDQVDIINRSSAFKEVVNDICNEGG